MFPRHGLLRCPRLRQAPRSDLAAGILCFLSLLQRYKIDSLIDAAGFPGTDFLLPLQSILAFVALNLSNCPSRAHRYYGLRKQPSRFLGELGLLNGSPEISSQGQVPA